jgi:uncharacterized membrane protein
MNVWLLAGTTFLASTVECVEAATIVLAVSVTQGWRTALAGSAWALVVLGAIVGVFGPLLVNAQAVHRLELVVGPFLVLFGMTWLRKAVWRYTGRKALHDEQAAFDKEVAKLRSQQERRVGFATAFQGVFVEGLEVAVIVVTFAATVPHALAYSIGGALVAALAVFGIAAALHAPLTRVPENALKSIVGVMLFSLGVYWTGEGLGIAWWAGDATLFELIACVIVFASLLIFVLKKASATPAAQGEPQ